MPLHAAGTTTTLIHAADLQQGPRSRDHAAGTTTTLIHEADPSGAAIHHSIHHSLSQLLCGAFLANTPVHPAPSNQAPLKLWVQLSVQLWHWAGRPGQPEDT